MNILKVIFLIIVLLAAGICPAQAKGDDLQNQIILLNDAAAVLEDTNPVLSKNLTVLADANQAEWDKKNANKDLSVPVLDPKQLKNEIAVLQKAAIAIGPDYPLVVRGLNQLIKSLREQTNAK